MAVVGMACNNVSNRLPFVQSLTMAAVWRFSMENSATTEIYTLMEFTVPVVMTT